MTIDAHSLHEVGSRMFYAALLVYSATVTNKAIIAAATLIVRRAALIRMIQACNGAITTNIEHAIKLVKNKSCKTCTTVAALISILF